MDFFGHQTLHFPRSYEEYPNALFRRFLVTGESYSVQITTWCVVQPSQCIQSRPKCIQPRPVHHEARKQRHNAKLLHTPQSLMVNSFTDFNLFSWHPFSLQKTFFIVLNVG